MNRTDRLTGIVLALRGGRRTAAQLADRFEVSRRTILRDVDALCQIGVPVVAVPGAGGGLALAEGYWLPPLHFSPDEATTLLLALQALGPPTASPLGPGRRTAEEKLRAALRPDVLAAAERELANVDAAPPMRPTDPAHAEAIRGAIRRGAWLRVAYRSLRRSAVHELLPRRLYAQDGRWYLSAVSLAAGERRVYRLDRVDAVATIPAPDDAATAILAADRPRRAYDDPSHPEVVVRFGYRGLRLSDDSFPTERARPVDGPQETWEVRLRCPPSELPYYARAVHAAGPDAEAVAPPELRALARELGRATAARYPGNDEAPDPAGSPLESPDR